MGQIGLFDLENRLSELSEMGDPLETINRAIRWKSFRPVIDKAFRKERKSNAGRPPYDYILMFKILVLQTMYGLSDAQTQFQILDRLTFKRFLELTSEDSIPDEKTVLGRIYSFPLATDDSSDQLLIPEKLYGREGEIHALLAAFDRVVARGTAELVLVSGYSGVGKSSVVNELHKVLVPPRGLFAAGKFDQYKRDVPYATLAQAFQMLVRQILVKSEAEVDHWRQALLEALGPNGQLMVNLIPEVEFVIGKQPPVAELSPKEERGRFQLVFRRFLAAFARPEHPLALFLDDLQWLDPATLELLERLITDPDVRDLLLIGAYRDNEVSSSHPLMRTLGAIRDAGAKTQEIVLAPLGLDDVERLVSDSLHCSPDSAGPLALLVHEKTGGNPFFAIQFLTTLVEEGLVRFDRDAAAWTWDLERIRAKGYSGNVVGLMLGKLKRLPRHTQTALQQLASLGNVAEIEVYRAGARQQPAVDRRGGVRRDRRQGHDRADEARARPQRRRGADLPEHVARLCAVHELGRSCSRPWSACCRSGR